MIRTFLFVIALWLVVIGSINWGLVGIFNIDLISLFFGNMTKLSRMIYGAIGLAGIYLAFEWILQMLTPKEDVISWPPLD
jgi:uncharacterized membrane protein YuzA (DUF378 family)